MAHLRRGVSGMAVGRRLAAALLLALLALAQCGKNYYDVLSVSKSSDDATIKRAYRKLAVKYHPDKNPGDEEATARFAEINNAYEVLSDKEKRQIYDQHGEEGLKQNAQRGGGGGNANDLFAQFFGGFGGGFGGFGGGGDGGEAETPKGRTVTVDLEVTLRDLYLGRTFQVVREKSVYKTSKAAPKRKCNCKAKMNHRQIAPGMFQQYTTQSCDECPGVKLVRVSEPLAVEVEPGMAAGQEVSFFEQGEPLLDGEPGDLKFVLKQVSPADPSDIAAAFERAGDDLRTVYSITLLEALVGFTRSFTHLDGREVTLTRTEVTRPGEVVRVEGEGMPLRHSKRKGDLFVTFTIRMPAQLDEGAKEALRGTFAGAAWQAE